MFKKCRGKRFGKFKEKCLRSLGVLWRNFRKNCRKNNLGSLNIWLNFQECIKISEKCRKNSGVKFEWKFEISGNFESYK